MTDLDGTRMAIEQAEALLAHALEREGCDAENASALAATLCKAEIAGSHSHGFFRLPGYLAALRSDKVNGRAVPSVTTPWPSIVKVDGDGGFAPTAHRAMLAPLCAAAEVQGVAIAALVHVHHFSALWIEVEMLAERGLMALACTSFKPAIPPAGGIRPLFGTNPLAFGIPREGQAPLVFDQASSVMSRGDVMLAARAGKSLPNGIGIGPEGEATNDPSLVLKGALLPFGGYKGASIALMIELLAGPLLGETLSFETAAQDNNDGGPPRGGEFILAINPNAARGDKGFAAHAERLFLEMLKQEGVRIPGAKRSSVRSAANGTIILQKSVVDFIEGKTQSP